LVEEKQIQLDIAMELTKAIKTIREAYEVLKKNHEALKMEYESVLTENQQLHEKNQLLLVEKQRLITKIEQLNSEEVEIVRIEQPSKTDIESTPSSEVNIEGAVSTIETVSEVEELINNKNEEHIGELKEKIIQEHLDQDRLTRTQVSALWQQILKEIEEDDDILEISKALLFSTLFKDNESFATIEKTEDGRFICPFRLGEGRFFDSTESLIETAIPYLIKHAKIKKIRDEQRKKYGY
jgi:hypothetical protein